MKVAIVWEIKAHKELILWLVYHKNKANPLLEELFVSKPNYIAIDKELDKQDYKELCCYDALIVLAELKLPNKKYTDFYGVEIVQQLRRYGYKNPVFICSVLNKQQLIAEGKEKHNILLTRGHYFLHILNGYIDTYKPVSLDDMELMDIQFHYCDLSGIIRSIFHQKQAAIIMDIEDAKKFLYGLFDKIKSLISALHGKEKIEKIVNELISDLHQIETKKELELFLYQDERKLLSYIEADTEGYNYSTNAEGNWEVLILDDIENDIENIRLQLIGRGITKVHYAANYNKAVEIIKNDIINKITAIISDYRLENPQNKELKEKQGYSFVKWLSRQNRLNEIFVLSGLSRNFLKESFKKFGVKVHIVSKYENTDLNFHLFIDNVIEKGNEVYQTINNLPNSDKWQREMSLFYKHYRLRTDYEKMEEEISQKATGIIKQIKFQREQLGIDLTDDDATSGIPFFAKVTTLPNLTARLSQPVKKVIDGNSDLLVKLPNEDVVLFESPKDEKYIEIFKNKLIGRRIAWYLFFVEGLTLEKIWSLLMNGEYYYKDRAKAETNGKTLINTRLAVKREDFPQKMLIEEKKWFKNDLGVDVENVLDVISGFQFYFTGFFEQYIITINKNRKEFQELEKRYIVDDKFIFHSANNIQDAFELFFKLLTDITVKKKFITNAYKRFNNEDKICEIYFDRLNNFLVKEEKKIKHS